MVSVKRWTKLMALGVAGLLLAACSSNGKTGTNSGSTGSTEPIVIGISLSATGDFSDPSAAAKKGYELWADTINANGGLLGRQVELKIVDDTSSPDQVVTNIQNLITKDHVDFVFGPFSTLLSAPAAKVANRYNYAFIEPAGGGPAIFDEKLENVFFVQPAPVVARGEVFANYILSLPANEQPKTAAYPELDDPFAGPDRRNGSAEVRERRGSRPCTRRYEPETSDFSPIVSRIAAANPDVVVGGTQWRTLSPSPRR